MTDSLHGLRYRAGQTEVALAAFELDHGCALRDLRLIAEHNRLLREHIESNDWLAITEANLSGQMNFIPQRIKKTKTNN